MCGVLAQFHDIETQDDADARVLAAIARFVTANS